MNLADRAAKMARPDPDPGASPAPAAPRRAAALPQELPDIDVEMPEGGPDQVPVHVAWSRLMADIRAISKSDKYADKTGTRYDYRSADRTVNAFAPLLRKHGVLVLPVRVEPSYRDARSKSGSTMHECTVIVTWMIVGPMGETMPSLLQSAGEAMDTSDKSTAKAQTVALRVLLLTAGMVPTGDPDPDTTHIDRGEAPVRTAAEYVEEICHPRTSVSRLLQIKHELQQSGQIGVLVTNEVGDEETAGALVNRIGRERQGAS